MSERPRAECPAFPQPAFHAGLTVREFFLAHVLCGLCHRLNVVDQAFAAAGIRAELGGPSAWLTLVGAANAIVDAALPQPVAGDDVVELGVPTPSEGDPSSSVDLQPDDGRM